MITFRSKFPSSEIILEMVEIEIERFPSIKFAIKIIDEEFCAKREVWFSADGFKDFVGQIAQCEVNRKGKAVLKSISPNFFEIQIRNTANSGKFIATYSISKSDIEGLCKRLQGGFELDAERFGETVKEFEDIVMKL